MVAHEPAKLWRRKRWKINENTVVENVKKSNNAIDFQTTIIVIKRAQNNKRQKILDKKRKKRRLRKTNSRPTKQRTIEAEIDTAQVLPCWQAGAFMSSILHEVTEGRWINQELKSAYHG